MPEHDRSDPLAERAKGLDSQAGSTDDTARKPGTGSDDNGQAARPDPETGEVPAGPGDAGLRDRPEVNKGNPGTKTTSNRRLGIGLGIAAGLAILALLVAVLA
ncbi:MAG TPA: hypothetical protein DEA05_01295 [Rhodobacteraceae bacterium]|nr:hypothetical protein [Paracoccaceae bacterium]